MPAINRPVELARPILLFSLGNPGISYINSYHSIGHTVLCSMQKLLGDFVTPTLKSEYKQSAIQPPAVPVIMNDLLNQEYTLFRFQLTTKLIHSLKLPNNNELPLLPARSVSDYVRERDEYNLLLDKLERYAKHPLSPVNINWTMCQSTGYMNLSGEYALRAWNHWLKQCQLNPKIDSSLLILLHDELEIPFGIPRLRHRSTSSRGHRGLKSVATKCQNHVNYIKLGVGIDRPSGNSKCTINKLTDRDPRVVKNYVLRSITAQEMHHINQWTVKLILAKCLSLTLNTYTDVREQCA